MKIEDLNLSALKYFLDAVQLESITLSAEKNHVSRPAVSQAIIRLEQWYGKELLVHEKRRFSLTVEGKNFYELAHQNFKTFEKGFSQGAAQDRSLRIGCSASLIDLVFPKIQGLISKSAKPTIKIGATSRLIELLDHDHIHLAFMIPTHKISNHKTFDFHSGNFELRSKSGDIIGPLIQTETRPETEALRKFAVKKKINFSHVIEVESWTAAHRLAEKIGGTCLVPNYIPKGLLRTIPMRGWHFEYTASVAFRNESMLSMLESELLQNLTK